MDDYAQRYKQQGLQRVEDHNSLWLHKLRRQATRIALRRGCVSTDDLRTYAEKLRLLHNLTPSHPNAWGAVFKEKRFYCVGLALSRHPSNHGRRIALWGLDPRAESNEQ